MDLLQRGAFLLEPKDDPLLPGGNGPGHLGSIQTDAAEEFFDEAVQNLFGILNDPDGGLPLGALEIGAAILGKLPDPDKQSRFRGLMFFQWFFCDYLPSVIVYPENVEGMLDYSISKEARERILNQVASRLQSQISIILSPTSDRSTTPASTMKHVEEMVSKLVETPPRDLSRSNDSSTQKSSNASESSAEFLLLSIEDITSILDCCFPKATLATASWDQYMTSGSSAFLSPQSSVLARLNTTEINGERGASLAQGRSTTPTQPLQKVDELRRPENTRLNKDLIRSIDRLRRELSEHTEGLRVSTGPLHPIEWTVIPLDDKGNLSTTGSQSDLSFVHISNSQQVSDSVFNLGSDPGSNLIQQAILRLVEEERPLTSSLSSSMGFGKSAQISLETLFQEKIDYCRGRADAVQAHFWWSALKDLRQNHPLCLLANDDTEVLLPMLLHSEARATEAETQCALFEEDYGWLKSCMYELRDTVELQTHTQSKLRDKMWFLSDVRHSVDYENAKGVASALKTMVMPTEPGPEKTEGSLRGRLRVRAFTGSLFSHSETQAMSIMKAAKEHGGPKKLSDEQIDITQKWLKRSGVENFCKGEERIHRFCLEVKTTVNKLIGDNLSNGPVLWSSDLYAKERKLFSGNPAQTQSNRPTSRPSSIISEDGFPSSSYVSQNPRVDAFARLQIHDSSSSPGRKFSFPAFSPERWRSGRESIISEISSMGDSPGRATVSSAADSVSSIWSPAFSHPQSTLTAATSMSRPPSIYNIDGNTKSGPERPIAEEKTIFLNSVRNNLVALLLSDLSSPTWSCGSETDAWLSTVLEQQRIKTKLYKRADIEKLLSKTELAESTLGSPKHAGSWRKLRQKRSLSAGEILGIQKSANHQHKNDEKCPDESTQNGSFSYQDGFSQLLARFSRCAGPQDKLTALIELRELVLSSLASRKDYSPMVSSSFAPASDNHKGVDDEWIRNTRRQSFNPPRTSRNPTSDGATSGRDSSHVNPTEKETVDEIKKVLMRHQPKTLFRDLQFISAFVPSETLSSNKSGTAFLQFSLAALSLKDDICQAMIEIADQAVAEHLRLPKSTARDVADHNLKDAANFWVITAKEGNPVAQRELAGLYLSRPDLLPRMTMPLSFVRDCFRSDGLRRLDPDLCLALHWMRLSASNGDELAKKKLKEHEQRGIFVPRFEV
ncbi:MAG: hypothetical protein Q9227_008318 [Pyrenula ochraceoflavens]